MEQKSETIFTIKAAKDGAGDHGKAKKKSGAVQIFRVALFMLRRRSKKSKSVDMDSDKGVWKRLLGSMRPLHIQSNESTQAAAEAIESPPLKSKDHFEDVLSQSSASPRVPSRSSSFSTSQYASASNLQELDADDDDGSDEEAIRDDQNGGDEMIDAKAEEFIAQFYEQMRLQRYNIY